MKLHIVVNSDTAVPVRDDKAHSFVMEKFNRVNGTDQELEVHVCNSVVFDAILYFIKMGTIKKEDLLFYYKSSKKEPIKFYDMISFAGFILLEKY